MKYHWALIIAMSLMLLTNCSTNTLVPVAHEPIDLDLDGDGTPDYTLKYHEIDIDPLTLNGGTYGISGVLRPYGLNEILMHTDERELFLRNLDQVQENVSDPLRWRNIFSRTIVTIITTNTEGDWPNKWEVSSDTQHSTYFFGLKLVSDFETKLGWIEMEINVFDGTVTVVDMDIL